MIDEQNRPAPTGAQAIERAITMLRLVSSRAATGIRLTDAIRLTGYSKSTAFRLLTVLKELGLLEQDETSGIYFLGLEAYALGIAAATRHGLHASALPHLDNLAKLSGDTCFLSIRRQNYSVCLARVEGSFPVRSHVLQVGDRHPLGLGAGSLAILATLPDSEITKIISDNMADIRANYKQTTEAIIWEDIEKTRLQGFALNPGRFAIGSWAIGVPVGAPGEPSYASLSISAMEQRLENERSHELASLLRREAEILSRKVGKFF